MIPQQILNQQQFWELYGAVPYSACCEPLKCLDPLAGLPDQPVHVPVEYEYKLRSISLHKHAISRQVVDKDAKQETETSIPIEMTLPSRF